MAVKIRLSRGGRKKTPFYHVVVSDERSPRDSNYIEKLGYYNPLKKSDEEGRLKWDSERVNYWLAVGAQPTSRVAKLIVTEKLGTDSQRAKLETVLNRRKDIIQTRIKVAADAKAAEAKAAADAAAAEKAANAAAEVDAPAATSPEESKSE